jgi:hypothetical protein
MDLTDLETMDRKALQTLAKEHGLKANAPSADLRAALTPLLATANAAPIITTKRKAQSQAMPISALKKTAIEEKKSDSEEEEQEQATANMVPFENCRFVITGTFPMSSDMIERRINALGGVVVQAVNKSTTHVMLGDSGRTEYGGQTGKGSKKYKDAKKQKCAVVEYSDLQRIETSVQSNKGAGCSGERGGSGGPQSALREEWEDLLTAIAAGVDRGLWSAPAIHPPASLENIAALERDMGFRIGRYSDLLLLADGFSWFASANGSNVSVNFGGTGEGEEDIPHAFNYSGDFGRAHFKRNKQVPMEMLDYDFCVNVFEVDRGRVMQDDRECEAYRHLAPSLSAWLVARTNEVKALVAAGQAPTDN